MRAALLALPFALALAACEGSSPPEGSGPIDFNVGTVKVETYRDPATGCDYLIFRGYNKGGITARLRPDGSPFCAPALPAVPGMGANE